MNHHHPLLLLLLQVFQTCPYMECVGNGLCSPTLQAARPHRGPVAGAVLRQENLGGFSELRLEVNVAPRWFVAGVPKEAKPKGNGRGEVEGPMVGLGGRWWTLPCWPPA